MTQRDVVVMHRRTLAPLLARCSTLDCLAPAQQRAGRTRVLDASMAQRSARHTRAASADADRHSSARHHTREREDDPAPAIASATAPSRREISTSTAPAPPRHMDRHRVRGTALHPRLVAVTRHPVAHRPALVLRCGSGLPAATGIGPSLAVPAPAGVLLLPPGVSVRAAHQPLTTTISPAAAPRTPASCTRRPKRCRSHRAPACTAHTRRQ
jgi:hypothetical protein